MTSRLLVLPLLVAIVLPAPAATPAPPGADALADAVARLAAAEDAEARIAALEAIAALDDPAAPRAEVARALARGLAAEPEADARGRGDERPPSVRARAVELLGAAHPGVAVAELAPALGAWDAELRRLEAEFGEGVNGMPGLPDPAKVSKTEYLAALKRSSEHTGRMADLARRMARLSEPRDAAVVALGRLADDRAVEALAAAMAAKLANVEAHGLGFVGGHELVDGLVALGTRPALEAVVAVFPAWERYEAAQEKVLRRLQRARPEPMPREFRGGRKVWRDREQARIDKIAERKERSIERAREWVRGVAQRVRSCAAAHDLEAPPEALGERAWSRWASAALEPLPASLGRTPVPE